MQKRDANLCEEVKKHGGVKCQNSNNIDAISDKDEICDLFVGKYESLFKCVSYNIV